MEKAPKATKEQIFQGARIAFAKRGFRATIRDIAKASAIPSPSLIFWYFKDKDELLMEVAASASPFSHISDVIEQISDQSTIQQIEQIATHYLHSYQSSLERQILLQVIGNAPAVPGIKTVFATQIQDVISTRMTEIVRTGQRRGEICPTVDAEFLAQTILGTLYALITRWEVEGTLPWTEDAIARSLVSLIQCTHVQCGSIQLNSLAGVNTDGPK